MVGDTNRNGHLLQHGRLLQYVLLQLGLGGERNGIAGLRHCVDVLDHGRGAGLRLEWVVRDR